MATPEHRRDCRNIIKINKIPPIKSSLIIFTLCGDHLWPKQWKHYFLYKVVVVAKMEMPVFNIACS